MKYSHLILIFGLILLSGVSCASPVYSVVSFGTEETFTFSGDGPVLWILNGENQTETGVEFTNTFERAGNTYISASNGDLEQEWVITVKRELASQTIDTFNESDYENLQDSISSGDWEGTAGISINPYTNLIGRGFYVIFYLLPFFLLWRTQETMSVPIVLFMSVGALIIGFIPEGMQSVSVDIIVFAYAATLFLLVKNRSG